MNLNCLSPLARRQMRFLLPGILAAGIFFAGGCGKKTEATTPAAHSNDPTAQVPGTSGPPTGNTPRVAPVTVAASVDATAQLAQLTQILRRFAAEHRQVPKSLNELVAAGYLAGVPAAPAGKQFAIEPKHLEVVLQ